MTVPVAIFTADHRHDVLRVMLHLYAKYWNWPAVVYGFKPPNFSLPNNIGFFSLGDMADYPAEKWSDGIIRALDYIEGERFVMLLEDYWLTRPVDQAGIDALALYMKHHGDIVRGDLTTDRLYAANLKEVEGFKHLDIIENDPPADYHFSTQAGIWDKQLLKGFMKSGETPWMSELEGTNRMKAAWLDNKPARVVGTRQCLVRYLIAVQAGQLRLDGGYQKPAPVLSKIDQADAIEILSIPPGRVTYAFAGVVQ